MDLYFRRRVASGSRFVHTNKHNNNNLETQEETMAPQIVNSLLIDTIIVGVIFAGVLAILIWVRNRTERVSALRLFVQIACVALIFIGLILGPFNPPQFFPLGRAPRDVLVSNNIFGVPFPDGLTLPVLACYYPSGRSVTCPIWQMQSYIFPFYDVGKGWDYFYTTPGLERIAIVFVLLIMMSIILGRLFCGWICPFGLYMDLMIRLRKVFRKPHRSFSVKTNKALSQLRYVIIASFLVISVILGSQALFGTQLVPQTQTNGYVTDYFNAPFCLICPMRPLCVLGESAVGYMNASYVFSKTTGVLAEAGYYVTSINIIALILVTATALAFRRFWCRICPLGGLTALFSTFTPFKQVALTKLQKDEEKCTKCGVCKRVCPTQVTEVYEEKGGNVTVSKCMLCFRCVEMCPYQDTLKVKFAGKTVFRSRNWLQPTESD
jgi:ferredoxin-type protein NapH